MKRAIISVYNKEGIVPLAKSLIEADFEIFSTGNTANILREENIIVKDVEEITGNPESFNDKVKTLSFNLSAAILFDREKESEEAKNLGVIPIDVVVCNFYPFLETKNIDIGGPTLVRSAAKNFEFVSVITDPYDYCDIIKQLKENKKIDGKTRSVLMQKAFKYVARYDREISNYFNYINKMPKNLKYGENPHQKAFMEIDEDTSLSSINPIEKLSYCNILDINAGLECISSVKKSCACVIIKHTNPIGCVYTNNFQRYAFENAWEADSKSAFGSVVVFNTLVYKDTIEFLELENKEKRKFIHSIVAPAFTPDALEYLKLSKSIKLVNYNPRERKSDDETKIINGVRLWQSKPNKLYEELKIVTKRNVELDIDFIEFGLNIVKQLKSNAIAICLKNKNSYELVGMGCGQPNRIDSIEIALKKVRWSFSSHKYYLFSDGFFPFADNIEMCDRYDISNIIQPGGSIQDNEVIKRCDELNIGMVFTGIRLFNH